MSQGTILQNRFDALPPLMKWQFSIQVEKKCNENQFANKEDLDNLMTNVEKASTLMTHLLTSNESPNAMHRYLKHFDRPSNMKKPMEILIDALEKGDEMIFRFCYLAQQKGFPLTGKDLPHPGLIQDTAEFEKWLPLMTSPDLKDFNSQNQQHMDPYLKWSKTLHGHVFQKRRANYTQAIQWYKEDYDPVSHNDLKRSSQVQTLQRDT